jgi:hypothetical protein
MSTSWHRATFIRLSHARAKSEILKLKIWNSRLRETTLTENFGPPEEPVVGSRSDNPTLEKTLVTKSEAIAGSLASKSF